MGGEWHLPRGSSIRFFNSAFVVVYMKQLLDSVLVISGGIIKVEVRFISLSR